MRSLLLSDPDELGIPDYFDVIDDPMDFGTIQTRLRTEFYGSQDEFPSDMRLVFDNAKPYNPEGDDVWIAANTLSELFERQWAKITAVTSAISPRTCWKDDDEDEGETSGAGPARPVTPTKGTCFENMHAPPQLHCPAQCAC